MTRKGNRDLRARRLAKVGGRTSVRKRLKNTEKVATDYVRIAGERTREVLALQAEVQAARYALKWYRRRWIYTAVALVLTVLAVAAHVLAG